MTEDPTHPSTDPDSLDPQRQPVYWRSLVPYLNQSERMELLKRGPDVLEPSPGGISRCLSWRQLVLVSLAVRKSFSALRDTFAILQHFDQINNIYTPSAPLSFQAHVQKMRLKRVPRLARAALQVCELLAKYDEGIIPPLNGYRTPNNGGQGQC